MSEKKTTSEAAEEVAQETAEETTYPTFTVKVNGKDFELEDRFRDGEAPGALMMATKFPEKYAVVAVETLIGEDQVMDMLLAGATTDELSEVIPAWAEARRLAKK